MSDIKKQPMGPMIRKFMESGKGESIGTAILNRVRKEQAAEAAGSPISQAVFLGKDALYIAQAGLSQGPQPSAPTGAPVFLSGKNLLTEKLEASRQSGHEDKSTPRAGK